MAQVLCVWEMGANLGHVDRMLSYARVLRERGHGVHFLLRDLSRAHGRLKGTGIRSGQAPVWLPRMVNPPRLGNYAAVLAAAGWLDALGLAGLLQAWRDTIELCRPDVVVCDHAPTAMLALRGMDLPVWAAGNSFEVPPAGSSFPPLLDDSPAERERCAGYDAVVLPSVNEALATLGLPALPRLAELFSPAHQALVTLPELAHYSAPYAPDVHWVGPAYVGDLGAEPQWPAGTGPRVFAYVEPTHAGFDRLMAALGRLGWPALVHAKGLSSEAAQRLGGPSLRFVAQPLRMDDAVGQADLVISHASLGASTAAALAGKPQYVLPNHTEQALVARRMVQAGVARQVRPGALPDDFMPDLQAVAQDAGMQGRARELAQRHAGQSPRATGVRLADLIEASLRRA